jgi:hypothetical protein
MSRESNALSSEQGFIPGIQKCNGESKKDTFTTRMELAPNTFHDSSLEVQSGGSKAE